MKDNKTCNTVGNLSAYVKINNKHDTELSGYLHMPEKTLFTMYADKKTKPKVKKLIECALLLKNIFIIPYSNKGMFKQNSDLFHDAMQNASSAMIKAIRTFDVTKNTKFIHYNWGYWRGSVSKTFRDGGTITIPPNVPAFIRANTTGKINTEGEGRDISVDAIFTNSALPINDGSIAYIEDQNNTTEETVYKNETIQWLEEAVSKETGILTDEERNILILHAGLFGNRVHSYKELASIRKKQDKGCSCSRISQIFTSAKKKVGKWLKEHNINLW